MRLDEEAYSPISDYAVIGDCHGAALVSRDGSVDWCCLGRFDADPVFCRLLDARRGGFLSVRPEGAYHVDRGYLGCTNILRTTFTVPSGSVSLTDFMPVGRARGAGIHDYVTLKAPFSLVRVVECLEGTVRAGVRYRPTVDFARRRARLKRAGSCVACDEGPYLHTDFELALNDDVAEGTLELHAGEQRHLLVSGERLGDIDVANQVSRLLEITRAFWEEWSAYCRYQGPYRDAVLRSALVLKLLTYAPTGAIVAAPTTSLPERIGGVRNWDYRYCWLRDATFILYALATLGYSGEARRFAEFLYRCCEATHPRVQIMYGIGGETELTEHTLDHLEGYRGSQPVRTGNAAFSQQQLDVYGEVLDWALLYRTLGGRLDRRSQGFLASMADYVVAHWHEPDQGIWEMRGPPRHHVHGKIMSWVAMDRAIRLFGRRDNWQATREAILRAVQEQGTDSRDGHLLQAFGESETDAALLLTSLVGFPLERPALRATVQAIGRTLGHGDFVQRYASPDGLEGDEGAFFICSFWLVDALLQIGRAQQARELYERLLDSANDVGLYAEEIDPASREFLGNFPQAFTHLALIQSAANLALYDEHGAKALRGTHADRARYTVEATAGLRALWAAFKKSGRVGRIWPSRDSILS